MRDALERVGYLVTKAGGSLGAFDIIALNRQGVRCIQVKSNRRPGPLEMERLREATKQVPSNATVEVWVIKDGQKEPMIEILKNG